MKADRKRQLQAVASLKKRFPFRLGTTSYIIPDDLVPNVECLAPLVDDVELVLFESHEMSNLPDADSIRKLEKLKRQQDLSYTVHLPLDIELGSPEEDVRMQSVEKCRRVIELTVPLDPFAYIVHFHGEMRGRRPAGDMDRWRKALDRSANDLLAAGANPGLLCIETLDYPFEYVSDIVVSNGFSICLDVGHLAFFKYPVPEYLDRYLSGTKVIHLHGNSDGEDHRNIGMLPPGVISTLIERLYLESSKERVLTMEIFGQSDFVQSMEVMREWAE